MKEKLKVIGLLCACVFGIFVYLMLVRQDVKIRERYAGIYEISSVDLVAGSEKRLSLHCDGADFEIKPFKKSTGKTKNGETRLYDTLTDKIIPGEAIAIPDVKDGKMFITISSDDIQVHLTGEVYTVLFSDRAVAQIY